MESSYPLSTFHSSGAGKWNPLSSINIPLLRSGEMESVILYQHCAPLERGTGVHYLNLIG